MQRVTVYVLAYNLAKFLTLVIESLLAQSYATDEKMVNDDRFQDATIEIAHRYPKLTLVRRDVNCGLGAVRNIAGRTARNEVVASLDADCVAVPEWLAALVVVMAGPKVAGVGGTLTDALGWWPPATS